MLKRLCLGLFALLVLGGAAGAWAQGKPMELRVAVAGGTTTSHFMEHLPEVTRHMGKSYTLTPLKFNSSAHQLQPLAARELDIGFASFPDFTNALVRAKLDLVIIADMLQDKQPYWSNSYLVRADSPIKKVADLRGKSIGVPGHGTSAELKLLALLEKHGLRRNDVTLVEVQNPNVEAMVRSGRIDTGFFLTPFWHRAMRQGGMRHLFKLNDAQGDYQVLSQVARRDFLDKHGEVVTDYLEDYLRVTRWFDDPKNHAAAVGLAAKVLKLPPMAFEPWAFTRQDSYKDPNGLPDLQSVQADIDWAAARGYLPVRIEVAKQTDLSLVRKAAARLKD
ncbi:MAG: ABC transporter substrate-binding protein [Candidatus Tectomicrobia bacterium]|nr:ABC transporter substrate-binding protein [Candidatus Tectomicrobia bacterium]